MPPQLDYDLGDLMDTGAAVAVITFRPSQLCVVTSRWAKAELDAVRAHLRAHWDEWNLCQLRPSNGEDGQTRMGGAAHRVLPDIVGWASSVPSGIPGVRAVAPPQPGSAF